MIVGVHDTLKILAQAGICFTKSWCWTRDDIICGSCVYAIFFAFLSFGPPQVIHGLFELHNNNMGNPKIKGSSVIATLISTTFSFGEANKFTYGGLHTFLLKSSDNHLRILNFLLHDQESSAHFNKIVTKELNSKWMKNKNSSQKKSRTKIPTTFKKIP